MRVYRPCRRCGADVTHPTGPAVCTDCSEVREVIWRHGYEERHRDFLMELRRQAARRWRQRQKEAA